jgi:hypothetical protein
MLDLEFGTIITINKKFTVFYFQVLLQNWTWIFIFLHLDQPIYAAIKIVDLSICSRPSALWSLEVLLCLCPIFCSKTSKRYHCQPKPGVPRCNSTPPSCAPMQCNSPPRSCRSILPSSASLLPTIDTTYQT